MSGASDLVVFVGVVLVLITVAMLIGYGVSRHVMRLAYDVSLLIALPTGVLVVALIGGGAAVAYGGPLGSALPIVCAALALGGLLTFGVDAVGRRVTLHSGVVASFCVIFGAAALYAWQMKAVFGFGALATVSWNNDVLSYAYAARHLADFGSGSSGWILGYDAGAAARGDVIGAYGLLVPSASLAGDSMRAALPVMCVTTAAIAAGIFGVVRLSLRGGLFIPGLAALLTVVGYPATYDAYQYFLSEKIAIGVTAVSIAGIMCIRGVVWLALWQAFVTIALVLTYPQAVPLQAAMGVLVGAACAGPALRFGSTTALRRGIAVVMGSTVGLAALGPYLLERIDRARFLLTVAAGWPMPTLSLLEAVGLPDPGVTVGRPLVAIAQLVVVGVVVGLLVTVIRRHDRPTVVVAVAMLIPFMLFVRFAISEFDSYRQWKAMAFAAPFAVVAIVLLIAVVSRFVLESKSVMGSPRARLVTAGAPIVVVSLWLALAFSDSFDATPSISDCPWPDCPIGSAVREDMAAYARVAGPGPVAVDLGPFWPSMTAAYYLWGRPIAMRNPNYWAMSDDSVTKTLTPSGWRRSPGP